MTQRQLNREGLRLLKYLCAQLKRWKDETNDPPAVFYGTTVADLDLADEFYTPGETLKEHGMTNLHEFTKERKLPAICGLIVSRSSGFPGNGYFKAWDRITPEGGRALNKRQQQSFDWWQREIRRARTFEWEPHINEAESLFGNVETPRVSECPLSPEDRRRKYGPSGEGTAHKQLKLYVAEHPEILGLGRVNEVIIEHPFPSGNRVDLLARLANGCDAVAEIETTVPLPGCHQAIMYRVLRTVELQKELTDKCVSAVLVANDFDAETREVAKRYNVQLVQVSIPA
jgi:hypothetical protein